MKEFSGDPPYPRAKSTTKRGRKPKVPLMKSVEMTYGHLHDLDWLQECSLAALPEVQGQANPNQFLPEGQALRRMLVLAARQVVEDIEDLPSLFGVRLFLVRYVVEGKRVVDIAREMGVTREWCSRHHRKEAIRLCAMQFVRNISVGRSDSASIGGFERAGNGSGNDSRPA